MPKTHGRRREKGSVAGEAGLGLAGSFRFVILTSPAESMGRGQDICFAG
jgi:hypothetical protein